MYNYAIALILNPIFIMSRLWRIFYYALIYVLNLSFINHNTEGHAHLISLIYSIIISLIAPYSYYLLYNNYWSSDMISPFVVDFVYNFSISYFLSDLLLGIQHYSQIFNKSILTTYVHHFAYIGLFIYGKYYNRYHLYVLGLPYEIPTVLLNIGYINRTYRNNILFGILFFICRILHNLYLLFKTYATHNDLFIFSLFTFVMHANWFVNYVKKYVLKI